MDAQLSHSYLHRVSDYDAHSIILDLGDRLPYAALLCFDTSYLHISLSTFDVPNSERPGAGQGLFMIYFILHLHVSTLLDYNNSLHFTLLSDLAKSA